MLNEHVKSEEKDDPPPTERSNKFRWSTHKVPALCSDDIHAVISDETYVIRSLKQGATGAVRTWPSSEILLDYLVCRGGLRTVDDKILPCAAGGILDLTLPPSAFSTKHAQTYSNASLYYNIVELGSGTGCLGVGLAAALNHGDKDTNTIVRNKRPTAKLMLTDNNRATLKNMRFNVSQQPRSSNMGKSVRVEPLDWGNSVGGQQFSNAVGQQFGGKKETNDTAIASEKLKVTTNNTNSDDDDSLRLVTHLIASDVHYGVTTLDPLASVIASFKLRNPDISVIVMLKERNIEAHGRCADLKAHIEAKVKHGLEMDQHFASRPELVDFSVSLRDVVHSEVLNMKLIEC